MVGRTSKRRRFQAHRPGISYGVLDSLAGYALRRAQLRVTEAFDARLAAEGVTTQRFSALVIISENPGLKQTELAEILGVARSGAMAIAEALEARALIERRASPDDARAQALFLSAEGRQRLPAIIAEVQAHDAEVLSQLSEAEVETLRRLLERVAV